MVKKQQRQDIHIAITPKGENYYRELVTSGYTNINTEQRTTWDILSDLIEGEDTRLIDFLAERHVTVVGRKLQYFSERGERGQIAAESYGRTLHRLIKEGYIKSWIP